MARKHRPGPDFRAVIPSALNKPPSRAVKAQQIAARTQAHGVVAPLTCA
jgi:hypothetical protein